MNKSLILAILIFVASCAHQVQTKAPAGPPEDELLYRQGLSAFLQATPEGYQTAADSFRKAAALRPANCEYELHLSESLLFLALYQRYNWEDYEPALKEATAVTDAAQPMPACGRFQPFVDRLRTMIWFPEFATGHGTEAFDLINGAIQLDPNDAMNWLVLAKLRPRDPRTPILRAAQLAPDRAVIQYELGNYRLDRKEYIEAKQAFEHALELSPRHFESVIGLAYSAGVVDYSQDILSLYRKAADMAPKSLRARTLVGDYYAGLEETELAAAEYQATIALNPKYYPAPLSMATTLMQADRNDEAAQYLDSVIALDLTNPHPPRNGVDNTADSQAHYLLGNIWLGRDDLVRARTEYEDALKSVLNAANPMFGIGMVAHREGKTDEALAQYEKVVRVAPNFPDVYLARAVIRAERAQFADAIADYNRAITLLGDQIAALEEQARTSEAQGFKRKAEGEIKRTRLLDTQLQQAVAAKNIVATASTR